jgi:hypothetical protein
MDQGQAEAEAARRNAEDPERARFEWHALPRHGEVWALLKSPRGHRVDPLTETTEAVPRPAHSETPTFGPFGDIPGYR